MDDAFYQDDAPAPVEEDKPAMAYLTRPQAKTRLRVFLVAHQPEPDSPGYFQLVSQDGSYDETIAVDEGTPVETDNTRMVEFTDLTPGLVYSLYHFHADDHAFPMFEDVPYEALFATDMTEDSDDVEGDAWGEYPAAPGTAADVSDEPDSSETESTTDDVIEHNPDWYIKDPRTYGMDEES